MPACDRSLTNADVLRMEANSKRSHARLASELCSAVCQTNQTLASYSAAE